MPLEWPVLALYGVGVLYIAGFVTSFFRLERAARRAGAGGPSDVEAYNRLLHGFPNALYARMLGRRPLEAPGEGKAPDGTPPSSR